MTPPVSADQRTEQVATRRQHAAWLRECARRADLLAAEYRANADRIDPDSSAALAAVGAGKAEAALRAAARDVRGMTDPTSVECEDWADWLDARADRAALEGSRPDNDRSGQ